VPQSNSRFPRLSISAAAGAVLACIFFFFLGRAFVPHLGIQNDEALFGAAIYQQSGLASWRWVFGHRVPLMLMSYLGGLKCWIFWLVFQFWTPGAASVRVPVLVAGAATVWLFFVLLKRISTARAALAGAVLLAADTSFLLTTCFDWGPVALQHLLLTGGVLLVVIFVQTRSWPSLAGGFFLFGLGVWDKALFCWALGGLSAATLAVYPREAWRLFSFRRAGVATAAFAVGALPLLIYNLNPQHRLETFRGNASWSAEDVPGKARLLRQALEGSALFDWLVAEDTPGAAPMAPRTALARASAWLSAAAGQPRRSLLAWGFAAALVLFAWLWRRQGWKGSVRVLAFTLVFLAVTWLEMALTKGAGGGLHHTVLLWPAPHLFIALALAGAAAGLRRGGVALGAAVAVLAGSSLLVTNQYYVFMMRNGGGINWTDAVYPLAGFVRQLPAHNVFVIDWGMLDTLQLLARGKVPLRVGSDPVSKPALDAADREVVWNWVSDPANVFVGHTEGNEFFPGARRHLLETAAGFGFRSEMLQVVRDRRGQPIFEVFRFAR